ncbi:Acyl-CoA N-acyltransferase [Trema orientale]|uniref:Acyl-CoA N-acyltransferase n=1 Tax=Trema orientale TaxID=63057 RepID=A0A2P5D890_TREOI|nr:Acyl-CoA N-acyltransferase [Trema orientale]
MDRVEGFVLPENKASQKVTGKAGFVKEGLLS